VKASIAAVLSNMFMNITVFLYLVQQKKWLKRYRQSPKVISNLAIWFFLIPMANRFLMSAFTLIMTILSTHLADVPAKYWYPASITDTGENISPEFAALDEELIESLLKQNIGAHIKNNNHIETIELIL
jgi:hypothetical protein